MYAAAEAMEPARAELAALIRRVKNDEQLDKRLAQWARETESFEPLGDALFQPAVRSDLAGQLMVRGREAQLVKLASENVALAFLDLPWDDALQAFQERVPTRKNELQRLLKAYAQRSDEARKLALESIQRYVKASLATHIRDGGTYTDFAQDIEDGRESLGMTVDDPSYLKMVFRTNVQSAYGAGRFRAITDPEVIEERPYVQYRTVGDARVRDTHALLDRCIFHAESPEWRRVAPPNSYNCRCSMVSLSEDEVGSSKVYGQVPANYVGTPEFDTAPTPTIEPANDNARELGGFAVALAFDPSQARADDGKWTDGGFTKSVTSTGKKRGSLRRRVHAAKDRLLRAKALAKAKAKLASAKAANAANPNAKTEKAVRSARDDLAQKRREVSDAQRERDSFNQVGDESTPRARPGSTAEERKSDLADAKRTHGEARYQHGLNKTAESKQKLQRMSAELKEARGRVGKSKVVRDEANRAVEAYRNAKPGPGRVFPGSNGAREEAYNEAIGALAKAGELGRAREIAVAHRAGDSLSDLNLDLRSISSRGNRGRVPEHSQFLNKLVLDQERARRKSAARRR